MSVRYEWADDRQIIMNLHLEVPWKWAEYHEAMTITLPMLGNLKHPCATVVDCTQMGSLPKDGNFLHILLNVEKNIPANMFASAIVAAPHMVTVFMNILTNLRPSAKVLLMFAETMPEAHEKIYARYQELQANSRKA